ncbi:unnamed protein product [Schistosoma mattheei]|uniref:Uncharacterized protein n=1 Tax=Schistosoma mattheei TaxID=31246 RepID=A0A3P8GUH1_9TREM|nr:unnamed protein product [Schistosoma mattheei]
MEDIVTQQLFPLELYLFLLTELLIFLNDVKVDYK